MRVGTDSVLIGSWTEISGVSTILDIGSGTGVIAIMMAQRTNAKIDTIEIDKDAFKQTQENIARCPWPKRINAYHSSVQDYVKTSTKKYNRIISNPPYFENSLKPGSEKRALSRHAGSLTGNQLIDSAIELLLPNGKFALIYPYEQHKNFIAMAIRKGLFCIRITEVFSTIKNPPFRAMMEFSQIPEKCEVSQLCIYNEKMNGYTEDYQKLTSDFYLQWPEIHSGS